VRFISCLLSLLIIPFFLSAQSLSIKKATGPITLDAEMNEPDWKMAEVADHFTQYFPFDTAQAIVQSEVRVTYNEEFVYVFAKMYNHGPRKYVTPSLRRDFRGETNDGFSVVFDTFKDRTNAFLFGVNPFGVQREGLIANGGNDSDIDFTLNWDNKWYSSVKQEENYWVAEIAIPFKTLRFKEGLSSWNINFYRIDSHYAERSTWSPIPRNFDIVNLAFSRELFWDKPLQKPGPNISIIPYTAGVNTKNFLEGTPTQKDLAIGGDAKIALSSALNLDLTINPDFSQVEVDQQVTNLDRFEIFFPERRQFFLENADLFANFGVDGTRPFFSRRIGIAIDTATGQNLQNPIYMGARLSGKLNNNLRLGLLTVQSAPEKSIDLPSTNYTIASLQQKIWSRSNIGVIVMNKQAFQDSIHGDITSHPDAYNRLIGFDFNLATKDNTWSGKAFYHHSFDQLKLDSAFAFGGVINYSTYRWSVQVFTRSVGANYNPEVGYVRRKDIRQLASETWYNFYPAKGRVQRHGPGFDFDMVGNERYGFLDWDMNFMYRVKWKSTAEFFMNFRKEYTYLYAPFDPSGTNSLELPANTEYTNNLIHSTFTSDARKRLSFVGDTRLGGYFNGTRMSVSGQLKYRFQPFGVLSVDFAVNSIRLPEPYTSTDLLLFSPRLDITFSRSLFWTTFVQFNNQNNNLNINSRLQWRFKPVSDIFLVYTDNYATASYSEDGIAIQKGQPKLRGIVLKITYWLNL
jgi:hypothetical protein